MSDIYSISGRIYPAKSGRLELIDILNEQIHAGYQPVDRASVTRPVLERVVADLEHAVQLLDALQDERDRRVKAETEIERLRADGEKWMQIAGQAVADLQDADERLTALADELIDAARFVRRAALEGK